MSAFRVYYTNDDFHVIAADTRDEARRLFGEQFPDLTIVSLFFIREGLDS